MLSRAQGSHKPRRNSVWGTNDRIPDKTTHSRTRLLMWRQPCPYLINSPWRKKDYSILSKPEVRIRNRLLERIDLQIEAVKAREEGRTFTPYAKRWTTNPETGEKELKDVPQRFSLWWWRDENGKLMVSLRYANRWREIKPKKTAIEVGSENKLIETLSLIREAVMEGELDSVLLTASEQRVGRFKANLQK